jgi:4'-phosphopantetheinyl transferase
MSARLYFLSLTLADVSDDDGWLNTAERARLAAMRFAKRRNDWRLGRWTAKRAVSIYQHGELDFRALSNLEIRAAPDGAPEAFIAEQPAPVSLSISHSRERSLCVVSEGASAAGCDLEWIEAREEALVEDYFAAEEIALVAQAPAAERATTVTLIWCAKESALKSLRQGLNRDTRSVLVSLGAEEDKEAWNRLMVRCLESSLIFHGWWRLSSGFIQCMTSIIPLSEPIDLALQQHRDR